MFSGSTQFHSQADSLTQASILPKSVKQGAVLSRVLVCIYVDDLLLLLSKAGAGCYIGPNFVGALAYADDIVLIALTPTALRRLLVICENYARDFNISFNSLRNKMFNLLPKERRDIYAYVENLEFLLTINQLVLLNFFRIWVI